MTYDKTLFDLQAEVAQFNQDSGTELGRMLLGPDEARNEIAMLGEELYELEKSLLYGQYKHKLTDLDLLQCKSLDTTSEWRNAETSEELRTHIADALGDILVVTLGTASKLGINMQDVLEEVNKSNFTKYNNEGVLEKNENGKIMKGENFREPNLNFCQLPQQAVLKQS